MQNSPNVLNFCLLFVAGTNVGDISLWEIGSRERLAHKPFKVWDISAASMPLQVFTFSCLRTKELCNSLY